MKGTGDEREDPEEKTYGGALVEAERIRESLWYGVTEESRADGIVKDLEERMDEIDVS